MKFWKFLRNIFLIIMILGIATAGVDYYRVTNGNTPIFAIKQFDKKGKHETFRGIFYIIERDIKWDQYEAFNLSSNIKYRILHKIIPITLERPKQTYDFVLYVSPNNCNNSTLYMELEDKKVYLDCISTIKVKEKNEKQSYELKEKQELVEDILLNLDYTGTTSDKTTEKFVNKSDEFVNKNIVVYKCNKEDVKDIYITMNKKQEKDYCMKKNDGLTKEQE